MKTVLNTQISQKYRIKLICSQIDYVAQASTYYNILKHSYTEKKYLDTIIFTHIPTNEPGLVIFLVYLLCCCCSPRYSSFFYFVSKKLRLKVVPNSDHSLKWVLQEWSNRILQNKKKSFILVSCSHKYVFW